MTAMIMHSPLLAMKPRDTSGVWRNSFAASAAVALHVGVLAALMGGGVDGKTPGGGASGDAHAVGHAAACAGVGTRTVARCIHAARAGSGPGAG